jgi:hypothetical protein
VISVSSTLFAVRARTLSIGFALLLVFAGCASIQMRDVRELQTGPVPFAAPAEFYYGVAWISADMIAFAVNDADDVSRIDVMSRDAELLRSFQPPLDPACARLTLRGLIRLPTGEIGAAEICTVDSAGPPEIGSLIAVDATTLELRDLGPTVEPPSWLAWRSDMTAAVYSVGDDLCAVLYERADSDSPLIATVESQGTKFDVGVDSASDPDRCPDRGRASYPAFARDDRLAFMASANSGMGGQDLLDRPWAIFIQAPGDSPSKILEGVHEPRGLTWLSDDRLVFSGTLGDSSGIWSVKAEGDDLVRVADAAASWLAVSPDGHGLVAIREVLLGDEYTSDVVIYDLQGTGL